MRRILLPACLLPALSLSVLSGCSGTESSDAFAASRLGPARSAFTTGNNCWDCWDNQHNYIGCGNAIQTCDDILAKNPWENCVLDACSDAPGAEADPVYARCYFVGCEADTTKRFVREATPYCTGSNSTPYYHFIENGCETCPSGYRNPQDKSTCCAVGQVAYNGACCTPLTQQQACNGTCAGTASNNCGGQYNCTPSNCPSGQECVSGTCKVTCASGGKNCGNFWNGSEWLTCGPTSFYCANHATCGNNVCGCQPGYVNCGEDPPAFPACYWHGCP